MKRNVELEIQLKNAKSISDLEGVIKDINKELKSVDVNSQAFTDLSETAKKANSSLNDVKDSLKTISDERQIDSVAKLGGAISASLSVATIAASHFGTQTQESIQKAIRTATELNAVVNSIKPIMEGLSSANRKAFMEFVSGFKASSIGATLFGTTTRAALTATGIGLFVVALATVVSYWDEITDAVGLTNHALDQSLKDHETLITKSNELNDSVLKRLEYELALSKARKESAIEIASQEVAIARQKLEAVDQEIQQHNELLNIKNQNKKLQQSDLDKEKELKALQQKRFEELQIAKANEQTVIRETLDKEAKENKAAADKRKADKDKEFSEELERIDRLRKARLDAISETVDMELRLERQLQGVLKKEQEKDLKELNDKAAKSFKQAQEALKQSMPKFEDSFDVEKFKAAIEEARPFIDAGLKGINDVAAALTAGIQRQFEQLGLQLEQVNADYINSTELRKSYEQELDNATGLRREQLLASIDEERKKESQLATEKKKLINEQSKAKNKQQEIEWKNSLINSIVQGALAVVSALPNIPLSIAVGILSAVETGIIASNKPSPIPTFAQGGATSGLGFKDHTGHEVAGVVHSGEYVVPANVLNTSTGNQLVNALEAMRLNMPTFAVGGFPDPPQTIQNNGVQFTPDVMKQIIESANIRVGVDEISSVMTNVQVIESRASLAA